MTPAGMPDHDPPGPGPGPGPGPRDHRDHVREAGQRAGPVDPGLQAERTALAWLRAMLGLAGVCLLLLRLVDSLGTAAIVVALSASVVLVALVGVLPAHHRHRTELMRLGEHPSGPLGPVSVLVLTSLVGAVSALAAVLVLTGP